ncbi:hypothetical protein BDF14DRAFT_1810473 [Spinellus fusiger]|nr:hypothetical protein BDF14DRAFT_1810473 [Spinellus fusiger]
MATRTMFLIQHLKLQRLSRVISAVPTSTRVPYTPSPRATRTFFASARQLNRVSDAEEHIKAGTEHLSKGAIDMAMNSYQNSVRSAPSGAGYFNIGVCYFQMGKHKDSIVAFKKSLEYVPHSSDAHTNMASAYIMLKDVPNAIRHLEQASNFNPLDGEIHYNLGCVYEATNNFEGAQTRFERAVDLGIEKAEAKLLALSKKA